MHLIAIHSLHESASKFTKGRSEQNPILFVERQMNPVCVKSVRALLVLL